MSEPEKLLDLIIDKKEGEINIPAIEKRISELELSRKISLEQEKYRNYIQNILPVEKKVSAFEGMLQSDDPQLLLSAKDILGEKALDEVLANISNHKETPEYSEDNMVLPLLSFPNYTQENVTYGPKPTEGSATETPKLTTETPLTSSETVTEDGSVELSKSIEGHIASRYKDFEKDSERRIDAIKTFQSEIYAYIEAKNDDGVENIAGALQITPESLKSTFEKAIQRAEKNKDTASDEEKIDSLRAEIQGPMMPDTETSEKKGTIDIHLEGDVSKKSLDQIDLEEKQEKWNNAKESGTFEEKILNQADYIREILDGSDIEKKARMFLVIGALESELREIIGNKTVESKISKAKVTSNIEKVVYASDTEKEVSPNKLFGYCLEEYQNENGITIFSLQESAENRQRIPVSTELLNEETRRIVLQFLVNEFRLKHIKTLKFEESSHKYGIKFDQERFSHGSDHITKQKGLILKENVDVGTYSFSGEVGSDGIPTKNWKTKKWSNKRRVIQLLKMRQKRLTRQVEKLSYVEEVDEQIENNEKKEFTHKGYTFTLNTTRSNSGNIMERYKHEIVGPINNVGTVNLGRYPNRTVRAKLSNKVRNEYADDILDTLSQQEETVPVKDKTETQEVAQVQKLSADVDTLQEGEREFEGYIYTVKKLSRDEKVKGFFQPKYEIKCRLKGSNNGYISFEGTKKNSVKKINKSTMRRLIKRYTLLHGNK